jgi:hypothetical protein
MKKYILIVAAFFTAGISGCKKNYLDLEVNPNTPSITTPALTLAAALNASTGIIVNDYQQYGVWDGYWTTSGNYVPNQGINQYQFTNSSFQQDWIDWYANLTNYNVLEGVSTKSGAAEYEAIAKIMKAYGFSHLVDNYNDVPYSQAFQGTSVLLPVYDKGPAIYTDLFKQLDAAIALLKPIAENSTVAPAVTGDIMFNGAANPAQAWIMFANTLKLRMAIRVSAVSGFTASTIMATTAAAADVPGSDTNFLGENIEGDVNPGYSDVGGKQNPFYANYGLDPTGNLAGGATYYRAGAYCVNTLIRFNDPRAPYYYTLVPTSSSDATPRVHGNVFGDVSSTNLTSTYTSSQGPGLSQSAAQNSVLLSGYESLFLQAEAVQKGYLTAGGTTPQALYEAAITTSFLDLGLTAAQASAYYSQTPAIANVNWSASTPENAIITQKWLSLNSYFNFEAWNEYRRTGIPALPSSIDPAAISPTLPTRLPYPLTELETNPGNLAKEGTINPFKDKIFWAK